MRSDPVPNPGSTGDPSDELLVERARARDPAAFHELVCRHGTKLRRLLARIVSGPADQDDAMQSALLSAWRYLPAFEGRAQFSSWMYRVTANTALMLLRDQGRRLDFSVGDIHAWADGHLDKIDFHPCDMASCWVQRPDEAMFNSEVRSLLQRKLADLPPILREIFVLRLVDGLSTKKAAEALGVTEAAVKTRLHRACRALREAIHCNIVDMEICSSKAAIRHRAKRERRPV
jgi:RNA polymerase sigma-70 factor (ECF subfamily)